MSESNKIISNVEGTLKDLASDAQDWAREADLATKGPPPLTPPNIPLAVPQVPVPPPPSGVGLLPNRPDKPSVDVLFRGDVPNVGLIGTPVGYRAPTPDMPEVDFDFQTTSAYLPGPKPTITVPQRPQVSTPTLKEAPEIVAPARPSLLNRQPPSAPTSTFAPKELSIDPSNLPTLADKFDYVEDPYSPRLLSDLEAKFRAVIEGQELLPESYWDRLEQRRFDQIGRAQETANYNARTLMAGRGFTAPAAPLMARTREIEERAALDRQGVMRDSMQMRAQMYREDVQTIMARGLALEELSVTIHNQRAERVLRAAVVEQQTQIDLFNAALAAYQTTELQTKEFLLRLEELKQRGKLAELEQFDRDLAAAGFALDFDRNQLALYTAEWSGEEIKSRAYAAYADAIQAFSNAQRAAVEAYGAEVEANNTLLAGWAQEWDAYSRSLEPDRLRIQAHNAKSSYYMGAVQKLMAETQQARDSASIELDKGRLNLAFESEVTDRYRVGTQNAAAKAQAIVNLFGAETQLYGTEAQTKIGELTAQASAYSAGAQVMSAEVNAQVGVSRALTDVYQAQADLWARWTGDRGRVLGSIASSAYTATNVTMASGADINTQYSYIDNEQRAWAYNMRVAADLADSPGLPSNPPIGAK